MNDCQLYYQIRKAEFAGALANWPPGRYLSPEECVQLHLGYASDFLGYEATPDDQTVKYFQTAIRAFDDAWSLGFVVYIVNNGLADTLSTFVETYNYPPVLPCNPYPAALLDWAKEKGFLTSFPCSGDIAIIMHDEYSCEAGFLSAVSLKSKKIKMIAGDVKLKGSKHRGVKEYDKSMTKLDGKVYYIDMLAVYTAYLKKALQIARLNDPEIESLQI